MALGLSWVALWVVSVAWAALAGNRMEAAAVDQWHNQEEASGEGGLSLLALEVPLVVHILWEGHPWGEEACWEEAEHGADSIRGALEVGEPFQEVPEALASEALLDACSPGGNVGGHLLVLLQKEAFPSWALLVASTQEEERVGKQEAYQAYPWLYQV